MVRLDLLALQSCTAVEELPTSLPTERKLHREVAEQLNLLRKLIVVLCPSWSTRFGVEK